VIELRGYTYHQGQEGFLLDTLVHNLGTRARKPADPKVPDPVGGKVSHPVLYQYKAVPDPIATQFHLINTTDLVFLATGRPAGKDGNPQPPERTPGGQIKVERRDGWRPIGPVLLPAGAGITDRTSMPVIIKDKDKKELPKDQFTRTEFIVLFVWKEPLDDPKAIDAPPPPPVKGPNQPPPPKT
jgi:hypothetical protein